MSTMIDTGLFSVRQATEPFPYEVAEAPWQEYMSGIGFLTKYARHGTEEFAAILVKNTQVLHHALLHCDYYQQTLRAITRDKPLTTLCSHELFTGNPIEAQVIIIPAGQDVSLTEEKDKLHILLGIRGELSAASSENATCTDKSLKPKQKKWKTLFKLWNRPRPMLTKGKAVILVQESDMRKTLVASKDGCILLHVRIPPSYISPQPIHASQKKNTSPKPSIADTTKQTRSHASSLEATLY